MADFRYESDDGSADGIVSWEIDGEQPAAAEVAEGRGRGGWTLEDGGEREDRGRGGSESDDPRLGGGGRGAIVGGEFGEDSLGGRPRHVCEWELRNAIRYNR
ncbi:hypothetical protein BGAL_0419g00060 [Botrytis galanthina]|uniref:Uncharacterized protein n=1 Tax=Botrytis galanthina TaxID=278940 RepID=A0A4S8QMA7_9HELO|nr:hypothetical protein BGAL_0419g00060 [Botrytis galanthina]